jgi:hypothetical protein
MRWHGSGNGKRGRRRKYSEGAIPFCLTINSLFNLALRQAIHAVEDLAGKAGRMAITVLNIQTMAQDGSRGSNAAVYQGRRAT